MFFFPLLSNLYLSTTFFSPSQMATSETSYRDQTVHNPSKLTNSGSFPSQFNALLFCFHLAPFYSSCALFGSSETVGPEIKYDLESHGHFINERKTQYVVEFKKSSSVFFFFPRVKFMLSIRFSQHPNRALLSVWFLRRSAGIVPDKFSKLFKAVQFLRNQMEICCFLVQQLIFRKIFGKCKNAVRDVRHHKTSMTFFQNMIIVFRAIA